MKVLLNFIRLVIKQGSELILKPSLLNLIWVRHGCLCGQCCVPQPGSAITREDVWARNPWWVKRFAFLSAVLSAGGCPSLCSSLLFLCLLQTSFHWNQYQMLTLFEQYYWPKVRSKINQKKYCLQLQNW